MNARRILSNTFKDVLHSFVGEKIVVACREGQLRCMGKLIEITDEYVNVSEASKSKYIPLNNIYGVVLCEKTIPMEIVSQKSESKLFERFRSFLGKRIKVIRVDCPFWREDGELKKIGEDYFLMNNPEENYVFCAYVDSDVAVQVQIK